MIFWEYVELKEAESYVPPFVGSAIPEAYGDNYKGYRIVGTVLNYFDRYNVFLLISVSLF